MDSSRQRTKKVSGIRIRNEVFDEKGNGVSVANPLRAARGLAKEIGTHELSGIMQRGYGVVFCPLLGEDGYAEPKNKTDSDGPAQVVPVDQYRLADRLSTKYTPYKIGEDSQGNKVRKECLFPVDAARTVLNTIDAAPNLRMLRGVTHTPIPRADGSLLIEPGFDELTGILYLPTVKVRRVPVRPTTRDRREAVRLLRSLVAEFSWVGEHDEANYLGLMLTPLLRLLCPSPYKLGAIMAHQSGSGKSLLAEVLRLVHGGVFRSSIPKDEAEMRKAITSILYRTTAPVVQFDNVAGKLKSPILDGLLTSRNYSDRILGSSDEVDMVNDRLWCLTGNNLRISGDLARRTLWVSIDPKVPAPQNRTGFALDLPTYVAEKRGEILRALLILIVAWRNSGLSIELRSSDSYAKWSATVRGILDYAGVPGEFDHVDSTQAAIDEEDSEWEEFLSALHARFGSRAWLVRELVDSLIGDNFSGRVNGSKDAIGIPAESLPAELALKAARMEDIGKSLGRWLLNREGQFAGAYTVRNVKSTNLGKTWKIEKVG
jgi:hypothetical protein